MTELSFSRRVPRLAMLSVLLVTALFPGAPLAAQTPDARLGTLTGKVLDPDGNPVNLAEVTLVASDRYTLTDTKGGFRFTDVPIGVIEILVRAPGYADRSAEVMVRAGAPLEASVTLAHGATTMLPEIVVVGEADRPERFRGVHKYDDYFRRKKLGSGSYRNREYIESIGATDVLGVLRDLPGVRAYMATTPSGVPSVNLRISRCPGTPPKIAIYLDGLRLSLPKVSAEGEPFRGPESGLWSRCLECEGLAETLSMVNIRDIEFVEFYRGVAQIPGDLDRTDNCAVLAMWTRQ